MSDVLAYGAGAREAAVDESALLSKLDAARQQLAPPFAPERVDLIASVAEALLGSSAPRPPAPPPISPSGPGAPRSRSSRRASRRACRSMRWRGRAASSFICRRRMSRRSFSIPGRSPISPATPISCACRRRSARACAPSSTSSSTAWRLRATTSQLFLHYPSQGDLGAKISARSDARVVWGGDAKVALFAPLPLRDGGKSIWFGDRFSFSTINGAALDKLDEPALRALAKKLHNDVFVFDQMACSSPHALYVVGEAAAHSAAVRRLLDASALEWTMDDPAGRVGHAIGKMTAAFYAAGTGRASSVNWQNTQPDERRRERAGASGYSGRRRLPQRRLHPLARRGRGLHPGERPDDHLFRLGTRRDRSGRRLAHGPGVSRWAPIGTALDFDFIWDGYDIPFELTRLIRVS